MLACSSCHYFIAWYHFPPTASWIWILPAWMLVLSFSRKSLPVFCPPLYVTLPIAAFGLLTLGNILSLVGVFQILTCLVTTALNWRANVSSRWTAQAILALFLTLFALGATYNYRTAWSMSDAERYERIPEHSRGRVGFFSLLPI